jgi:hypothetical protein
MQLPLRKEAISDSPLIEHLERAYVQPACAQAGEVVAFAPLDDGDIDSRQRQLTGQHQARWASPRDHYRVLCSVHAASRFVVHVDPPLPTLRACGR